MWTYFRLVLSFWDNNVEETCGDAGDNESDSCGDGQDIYLLAVY
jgi:hypothetical protein